MKRKFLSLLALALTSCLPLASCKKEASQTEEEGMFYLHVLNAEDYIDESLLDTFHELYPNCTVIYETYDTNETMYNELQTGKANYDLVCCSEYMVQRLASERLIRPIEGLVTYEENVSDFLTNDDPSNPGMIDTIEVYDKYSGEDLGKLSSFAKGYMWGTLGIVYNPEYKTFVERGLEVENIVSRLNSDDGWSEFWNADFKGTQSIKDSMRDTYALGIFEVFKDKFLDPTISHEDKNNLYFNNHSPETIELVKNKLIELKSNIFGFEVDGGKNDIVTGKIGMNLAWSGDACFSILQGDYYPGEDESYEEEKPEGARTDIYYALPTVGSNIWFDAWCMPQTVQKDSVNEKYAKLFLDFLCEPENVIANMSYSGYTSFMSGNGEAEENEILSYILDSYDAEEVEEGMVEYDITYFFNGASDVVLNVDESSWEGRTLKAQYPEASDLDRLYVMEDFGSDNSKIVKMWEDVKVNPLPTFVVVVLLSVIVLTFGYLGSYKLIKAYKVKKRKSYRQ